MPISLYLLIPVTPVSETYGSFNYSVSDNTISCSGYRSSGDGTEEFQMFLEIHGDRLIPIDKYTQFILTRDGSVVTNGDGDEVIDKSDLLQRVWVETNGTTVMKFGMSTVEEYILESPYSSYYKSYGKLDYSYSPERNKLWIGSGAFDIRLLDESSLSIIRESDNVVFEYTVGDESDIPEGSLYGMLTYKPWGSEDTYYTFYFTPAGGVVYFEESYPNTGNWDIYLRAEGTFSVSGNKVQCNYTSVWWAGGESSQNKNIFSGWTYGKPCTKTYTVTIDGNTLEFEMPNGVQKIFN